MRWKVVWLLTTAIASIQAQVPNIDNSIELFVSTTQGDQDDFLDNNVQDLDEEQDHEDPENFITTEKITSYYTKEGTDDPHSDTDSTNIITETDSNNILTTNTPSVPSSEAIDDVSESDEFNNSTKPTNLPTEEQLTTEQGSYATSSVERSNEVPIVSEEEPEELLVETEYGVVGGGLWPGSVDIVSYLDIPYGRFNNSFEAPIKPEPWENVLKVDMHSKRCPQIIDNVYVGGKDCLTLSVFTVQSAVNTSVLFHIHESEFKTGSGDPSIYGPEYLVRHNVTLVLPNYRLGALGFLCLRNDTAPGNAALKDLALALEWTKKNIEKFGGDPTNIVVSGDGTAGALAGYLAISSKTKEHVGKVITDSGTLLSHWAIDRNPVRKGERVAENIRNNTEGGKYDDNFYGGIDIETLITLTKDTYFKPCLEDNVEGAFITATPWKILHDEKVNIPFVIGCANHAGLREAVQHDDESLAHINNGFQSFLPNDLAFGSNSEMSTVSERLKQQYFGAGNITLENLNELSLYYTDASYLGPGLRVARALVSAGATVYVYEFAYVGELNKDLMAIDAAQRLGAVRGDIVGYLFNQDRKELLEETEEKIVVDTVTNLWVSFMRTGEPSSQGVTWKPMTLTSDSSEDWISINTTVTSHTGYHHDRLRLWTDIYREYFIDRNTASRNLLDSLCSVTAFCLIAIYLF